MIREKNSFEQVKEQGAHVDQVADRRLDLRSSETVVLFDHVADHAISIIQSGPLASTMTPEMGL